MSFAKAAHADAERLAQIIRDYWAERGAVGVYVEPFRAYPGDPLSHWEIRSNLVGGLPPR